MTAPKGQLVGVAGPGKISGECSDFLALALARGRERLRRRKEERHFVLLIDPAIPGKLHIQDRVVTVFRCLAVIFVPKTRSGVSCPISISTIREPGCDGCWSESLNRSSAMNGGERAGFLCVFEPNRRSIAKRDRVVSSKRRYPRLHPLKTRSAPRARRYFLECRQCGRRSFSAVHVISQRRVPSQTAFVDNVQVRRADRMMVRSCAR